MDGLLSISRVAAILSKEAETPPPTGPELNGENPINLDQFPHGTEAHTRRIAAQGVPRIKMMQGPRAHAPRFSEH
jgi:hypothetical protein